MRGQSTAQISAALFIAPYTVQDHLKAIFEKVGVHSRKDLMGRVFFEHFLPRITAHAHQPQTACCSGGVGVTGGATVT